VVAGNNGRPQILGAAWELNRSQLIEKYHIPGGKVNRKLKVILKPI
jgi:hypothetical protein